MRTGYRVFAQPSLSSRNLPCSAVYETKQEALAEATRLRDLAEMKGCAALLPLFNRYCGGVGLDPEVVAETSGFAFFARPADFETDATHDAAKPPSLLDAIAEAMAEDGRNRSQ
jgi:hypothetical protein